MNHGYNNLIKNLNKIITINNVLLTGNKISTVYCSKRTFYCPLSPLKCYFWTSPRIMEISVTNNKSHLLPQMSNSIEVPVMLFFTESKVSYISQPYLQYLCQKKAMKSILLQDKVHLSTMHHCKISSCL